MGGNASDWVVRAGRREDYERLGQVFDEAESLHREALPDVFRKPPGRVPTREHWQSLVDGDDTTVLVAEGSAGDLVGFAAIRTQHAPDDPMLVARRTAFVDLLAVRSDAQNHGIGKALMAGVHRWAAAHGLDEVVLNVWEFNERAVRFYEALGYKTLARLMRLEGVIRPKP
jgi:ribosomal protein S18 acetylase RimI-like enzyme